MYFPLIFAFALVSAYIHTSSAQQEFRSWLQQDSASDGRAKRRLSIREEACSALCDGSYDDSEESEEHNSESSESKENSSDSDEDGTSNFKPGCSGSNCRPIEQGTEISSTSTEAPAAVNNPPAPTDAPVPPEYSTAPETT